VVFYATMVDLNND